MTMVLLSSTLVKSADCAFRRCQKRVWCCGATWIVLLQTKTTLKIHRKLCNMHILEVTGCASGFLTRTWLTRVPTTWMMDQRSLRKMESWFWRFLLPAQMGHAWIQAWCQNIHVFCTTNYFMQWKYSQWIFCSLVWSSLPQAIRYPSTGTLVQVALLATRYLLNISFLELVPLWYQYLY